MDWKTIKAINYRDVGKTGRQVRLVHYIDYRGVGGQEVN